MAARSGRSAEAERRRILEAALIDVRPADDFFSEARARRVRLPAGVPDTTELLRRDRERDATHR
jgi:plasmid stability protein